MPHRVLRDSHETGGKPAAGGREAWRHTCEAALWEQLREHRCAGFRFRRRATILGGIADFYCAAAKIVVQVAGGSRRGHRREDARNEQALAGAGLRIVRVPARVVAGNPRTAARLVADALMESGHAPGPARASRYHVGPGPVGDAW